MPALDVIHVPVRSALVKDGWTIIAEPYVINYEKLRLYGDFGVESAIGVERAGHRLVVEAKSFRGFSPIHDFEAALGQYMLYRACLEIVAADTELYLAVPTAAFDGFLQQRALQMVIRRYQLALIV